ncbi:hypothetical protein [Pseudoalteromonas galatheae]|uniref:hypothetical protein n=1 Tax=Pseudoalteromonas galatheae TaxID=579562 RepID=UPI0030D05C7F
MSRQDFIIKATQSAAEAEASFSERNTPTRQVEEKADKRVTAYITQSEIERFEDLIGRKSHSAVIRELIQAFISEQKKV